MDAIGYEHIRQLSGRYNLGIHLGSAESWAATFTPDGVIRCTGMPADVPLGGRRRGHQGTDDELIAYGHVAIDDGCVDASGATTSQAEFWSSGPTGDLGPRDARYPTG